MGAAPPGQPAFLPAAGQQLWNGQQQQQQQQMAAAAAAQWGQQVRRPGHRTEDDRGVPAGRGGCVAIRVCWPAGCCQRHAGMCDLASAFLWDKNQIVMIFVFGCLLELTEVRYSALFYSYV